MSPQVGLQHWFAMLKALRLDFCPTFVTYNSVKMLNKAMQVAHEPSLTFGNKNTYIFFESEGCIPKNKKTFFEHLGIL